jgi:hypothetical protein
MSRDSSGERNTMKKFRFQLMAQFIIDTYPKCRVADIGGGQGLLSALLMQNGFDVTIIDPWELDLPWKFRDIDGKMIKNHNLNLARVYKSFGIDMAQEYDLLVSLHGHGCMMNIVDSAHNFKKDFAIVPCCVIDEPIIKERNIDWTKSLFEKADQLGLNPSYFNLRFKGKNIGIYTKNFLS